MNYYKGKLLIGSHSLDVILSKDKSFRLSGLGNHEILEYFEDALPNKIVIWLDYELGNNLEELPLDIGYKRISFYGITYLYLGCNGHSTSICSGKVEFKADKVEYSP